jgi:hypothetical protein
MRNYVLFFVAMLSFLASTTGIYTQLGDQSTPPTMNSKKLWTPHTFIFSFLHFPLRLGNSVSSS